MPRLRFEVSISDPSQELQNPLLFSPTPPSISIVNLKLLKLPKYKYALCQGLKQMDHQLRQSVKFHFSIHTLGTGTPAHTWRVFFGSMCLTSLFTALLTYLLLDTMWQIYFFFSISASISFFLWESFQILGDNEGWAKKILSGCERAGNQCLS